MTTERIDKILVRHGYGSRREVAQMASQGRVCIDNQIVKKLDTKIDPDSQTVFVDGIELDYHINWYIMLNKPKNVVTATKDNLHNTVIDILPEYWQNIGLFAVGRLDKDTEGLLLLTTDGDFGHSLMSPKKHVSKVYEAQVEGELMQNATEMFEQGIVLKDETICKPAVLEIISQDKVRVTIHEGKFHQVKRMLLAVGVNVVNLKRIKIGGLCLDESLPDGEARELSDLELSMLKQT